MKLWNWWIRDALGVKPSSYSGRVDNEDIVFALVMTLMFGAVALMVLLGLLAMIVATKGIALIVLAIFGAATYGLYKAVDVTARRP